MDYLTLAKFRLASIQRYTPDSAEVVRYQTIIIPDLEKAAKKG